MSVVPVSLKERSYRIVIGRGLLARLPAELRRLKLGPEAVIVTNPVIARLHGRKLVAALHKYGFTAHLLTVPDGEKSKSFVVAAELIGRIARVSAGKKIVLIAMGGGVVGDLTGFVAAIYRRGVPYVQVPTTLLAQIDSAIGGKTAIDLPVGKNLVGAFYQPKLVLSDVALLATLSRRQIRNGLAEAVKYGVIRDRKLFAFIRANHRKLLACEPSAMTRLVDACAAIKADVVSRDERETKGLRTILNFGHTVGHALEAASRYDQYQHGEAIAVGMRVAAEISCRMGLLKRSDADTLGEVLTEAGLPERIRGTALPKILNAMRHDKKFTAKGNRFVLATAIGRVKVVDNVPEDMIRRAIEAFR